jgi:hypothetical protein
VAVGVPENSVFETQTRKEIGKISWYKLNEIPHNNSFFMVVPFLPHIKNWVKARKKAARSNGSEWLGLQASPAASRKGKKGICHQQQHQQQVADQQTFGATGQWAAEETFRTNDQLFGVQSDYDFEKYTTPLPLNDHHPARNQHYGNYEPKALQPQPSKQISLMHLLQPTIDPAKENCAAMAPPPNQDHQWQAWNMQEMQRAQCHALGTPASMPGGIYCRSPVPSSSMPNSMPGTPEHFAHPGLLAVPNMRTLPVSQATPTTAVRLCSTETSSTDAKFHFDTNEILGAMIF